MRASATFNFVPMASHLPHLEPTLLSCYGRVIIYGREKRRSGEESGAK